LSLGEGLRGLVLLGAITSLPELAVAVTACASGTPMLAFTTFSEAPRSICALLAIALTGCFIIGMIERRGKTILRMDYDSLAVHLCYRAGVVVLYQLR